MNKSLLKILIISVFLNSLILLIGLLKMSSESEKNREFWKEHLKKMDQNDSDIINKIDSLEKEIINYQISFPDKFPLENEKTRIMSRFGWRKDPVTKKARFHFGIDLRAPWGTKVHSSGKGIVKEAGWDRISGRYIIIDHGYGYQIIYCHLSKISIKKGQTINKGELIGKVGSTGKATGPHLHYEIIKDGKKVNPSDYLYGNKTIWPK